MNPIQNPIRLTIKVGLGVSTRERRIREVAEREQLFLAAARELIRQEGLLNLQMARVAEKCDYAVGTLYQHFTSKEDLLVALSIENSQQRVELFDRVARWKAPTRDRIFGFSVADMWMTRLYPEHARLERYTFTDVVWGAASPQRRQQALDAGEPLGKIVESVVVEAVEAGDVQLNGLRAIEVSLATWSMSEGTHMIAHVQGVAEQLGIADPYRLMLRHQQTLLNGLGWQPLFDATDEAALDAKIEKLCQEVFHDLQCPEKKS